MATYPGLRAPAHTAACQGEHIYIVWQGRFDRDGSLTYVEIDSCWTSLEAAKDEVDFILRVLPGSIRQQFHKSLKHPNKWSDSGGNFYEIQQHELRVSRYLHAK